MSGAGASIFGEMAESARREVANPTDVAYGRAHRG